MCVFMRVCWCVCVCSCVYVGRLESRGRAVLLCQNGVKIYYVVGVPVLEFWNVIRTMQEVRNKSRGGGEPE